jgi:hypothetical protein
MQLHCLIQSLLCCWNTQVRQRFKLFPNVDWSFENVSLKPELLNDFMDYSKTLFFYHIYIVIHQESNCRSSLQQLMLLQMAANKKRNDFLGEHHYCIHLPIRETIRLFTGLLCMGFNLLLLANAYHQLPTEENFDNRMLSKLPLSYFRCTLKIDGAP